MCAILIALACGSPRTLLSSLIFIVYYLRGEPCGIAPHHFVAQGEPFDTSSLPYLLPLHRLPKLLSLLEKINNLGQKMKIKVGIFLIFVLNVLQVQKAISYHL